MASDLKCFFFFRILINLIIEIGSGFTGNKSNYFFFFSYVSKDDTHTHTQNKEYRMVNFEIDKLHSYRYYSFVDHFKMSHAVVNRDKIMFHHTPKDEPKKPTNNMIVKPKQNMKKKEDNKTEKKFNFLELMSP